MASFSTQLLRFYKELTPPAGLPKGFSVIVPRKQKEVVRVMQQFYSRYYSDTAKRILLLGINPGRFGAGATGIHFTAPLQLKTYCNIAHSLHEQSELSAAFIYEMIAAYGGVVPFFRAFYIGAVCPFGLLHKGKNSNYYDSPALLKSLTPFIIASMNRLLTCRIDRSLCVCIGEGKNVTLLKKWNEEHGWFGEVIPLAHPRFIMQYRRRQKTAYINAYLRVLRKANDRVNC